MIEGRLDAEGGATLRAALNALDEPWKADDNRSGSQRRADALVELARQRLDAGTLAEVGGQKPHLSVTASMSTLMKEPGCGAAELEWSQPITADTAHPHHSTCAPARARRARQALPVSGLRPSCRQVRWTSPHPLDKWRRDQSREYLPPM